MQIDINGTMTAVTEEWAGQTLLNVLREHLGLVGTKFGCGVGVCGACTVIVDGAPTRSCLLKAGDIAGARVETIEGLEEDGTLHPVQQAWLDQAVPQCGYCQSGQMMSAVALLRQTPKPSDEEIDAALDGSLCRCGTYRRIRAAIHQAAEAI